MYGQGELLMKKGDFGHELFIIMVGKVGVYVDDGCQHCVYELTENKTYGERSIQTPEVRQASLMAHKVTVAFVLERNAFHNQVFHIEHMQKTRRLEYLQKMHMFKTWSPETLNSLNSNFCQQKYRVNEAVYEIGATPDIFYILLSGSLVMETEIIVDEQNRFPIGVDTWELHTTKRKIKYEVKELEQAEIFGHEELIELIHWQQNGEQGKKPARRCRIIATQCSEVIYLSIDDF